MSLVESELLKRTVLTYMYIYPYLTISTTTLVAYHTQPLSSSLQNHCSASLFRSTRGTLSRRFAISHALFRSLRKLFHFSDVLVGLRVDCADMHFIVGDHCFLTGELLVAGKRLEVDFFVGKDGVPRVNLDILVEFTLLHFTDQFAMLYGNLVDKICPP